jgi:hypothetical protein
LSSLVSGKPPSTLRSHRTLDCRAE